MQLGIKIKPHINTIIFVLINMQLIKKHKISNIKPKIFSAIKSQIINIELRNGKQNLFNIIPLLYSDITLLKIKNCNTVINTTRNNPEDIISNKC